MHSPGALVFLPSHDAEVGFAGRDVDTENTTDSSVVRELLQNAVDAGAHSVVLSRTNCPTADIPHIQTLRTHFKRADQHTRDNRGPVDDNIVNGIRSALDASRQEVLICIDNGSGISDLELQSLYGTGKTAKHHSGLGSVGVGHLAPFAVSALRYVMYAGWARHGPIFGGQAILATHLMEPRKRDTQRSHKGYIFDGDQGTLFAAAAKGASEIPEIWEQHIQESGHASGSLVAVAGYTPRAERGDNEQTYEEWADATLVSTVKNFLVRIMNDKLVVQVEAPGVEKKADRGTAASILDASKSHRRRGKREKDMSGAAAHAAFQTVAAGPCHTFPIGSPLAGVTVYFRRCDPSDSTRVEFFRDGMWIADDVKHLSRPDFADCNPFSAVVTAEHGDTGHQFAGLVRRAEGGSHLRVSINDLPAADDRRVLGDGLKEIRDFLRGKAGEKQTTRHIIPECLRILRGEAVYAAPPAPEPEIHDPDDPEQAPDPEEVPDRGELDGPDSEPSDGDLTPDKSFVPPEEPGGGAPNLGRREKRGNSSGVRASCVPDPDDPLVVHVAWRADAWKRPAAGVYLLLATGSDPGDESPLPRRKVSLRAAGECKFAEPVLEADLAQALGIASGSALPTEGVVRLLLAEAGDMSVPLTAEIVHRAAAP